MNKNITIVTGLWDLDRGNLDGWAKRDFSHYKDRFFELLETDVQMCIWIPKELEDEVLKIRGDKPTKIFIKNIEDFETWNPFFDKIQEIRLNPDWKNFAGWLPESPQAALKYYNPMMFTKMFMVNDSAIINPFNSEYFYWVDGGLTNTVNKDYFTNDKVLDLLENYTISKGNKFIQISYPYESNDEIHGFERKSMAKYCNTDFVNYVCRGGFFGGHKNNIHHINTLYYEIMDKTLSDNLMGADECLFTILAHKYPELVDRFVIEHNGLVWPFFENLKSFTDIEFSKGDDSKIGLYVITFNSPNQFEILIKSMIQYDPNFISETKKFLLDNSTDLSTTPRYIELCEQYGFEHIKKDNLGICGGRQWVAEHFDKTNLKYMWWSEDDMMLQNTPNELCRNGFNRYTPNLFKKCLKIMMKEDFDFLKINYSEYYGDNGTCWAWYNLPQIKREEYFPEKPNLPEHGLDPNAPKTKFNKIMSLDGLPYIDGEIYYCNWTHIISKKGNKKMFLDTTWVKPYENVWMSHHFQMTKQNQLRGGLLLLTPVEHNRFVHYDKELRKES